MNSGTLSTRAYHVIPVPTGWSVEQAWGAISRHHLLTDQKPSWAVVAVEDGNLVGVVALEEAE